MDGTRLVLFARQAIVRQHRGADDVAHGPRLELLEDGDHRVHRELERAPDGVGVAHVGDVAASTCNSRVSSQLTNLFETDVYILLL